MRPRPGPAQRRSRGVSDGGRPQVGGRFRQPDKTPFFRLTPAFGLRSLDTFGPHPKRRATYSGGSTKKLNVVLAVYKRSS